jgi:hypothetical protein
MLDASSLLVLPLLVQSAVYGAHHGAATTTTVAAFVAHHRCPHRRLYRPATAPTRLVWTTATPRSIRLAAAAAVGPPPDDDSRAATSATAAAAAVSIVAPSQQALEQSWPTTMTTTTTTTPPAAAAIGQVVRIAAKAFHPQHSKPSSREYYTTHKPNLLPEQLSVDAASRVVGTTTTTTATQQEIAAPIAVTVHGLEGDYNHYRQTVLNNTLDRAISILTTDCYTLLQRHGYPDIVWGDLGENILVDNVNYTSFDPAPGIDSNK